MIGCSVLFGMYLMNRDCPSTGSGRTDIHSAAS